MNYDLIHGFSVTREEMVTIQTELRSKIQVVPLNKKPKTVAGVDVAYFKEDTKAIAVIVVLDYETMRVLEVVHEIGETQNEYVPGFLAFREIPIFLKAWEKLQMNPDLVFFDGNGMMHPTRMGLATHASFFINKPTVGIAKTPFSIGEHKEPEMEKGSYTLIEDQGEVIGACLRTRDGIKPNYVSVGNGVTLEEAIEHTLHFTIKESRYPQITKIADTYSKEFRRKHLEEIA